MSGTVKVLGHNPGPHGTYDLVKKYKSANIINYRVYEVTAYDENK